jgi:hypothetical protein
MNKNKNRNKINPADQGKFDRQATSTKPKRFRFDVASLLRTEGPSVTWQDETCTRKS